MTLPSTRAAVNTRPVRAIEAYIDSMLDGTFPNNICEVIETRFNYLGLDLNVVSRMPDTDDANYTIGIVPVTKLPLADSNEIKGLNTFRGATVLEHLIVIYSFVKDADRIRGAAAHSVLAEIVEHTLADDQTLAAALKMLETTVMGQTKRMGRYYIRQTRYLANEIGGNHLYLSATETIFEVEKVR